MRVLFDNVVFSSNSGPNSFGLKLAKALTKLGVIVVESYEGPDVQLSFIQQTVNVAPIVQRLDGIWFNTSGNWQLQNAQIKETYDSAKAVIVQSNFDKKLVEKFFGKHDKMSVIHNGTDINEIMSCDPLHVPELSNVEKVWTCAASWRKHKRLSENIRYFLENSGKNDCLIIAGNNPDVSIADQRIFYAGMLDQLTLNSLYRSTDVFLHLAWLDHCPNVVVDARAAGCHIVCTNSGGTHEIAGENSTIIEEVEWDFEPCDLYNPPQLDFSKKVDCTENNSIDINDVSIAYMDVLKSVC